MKRHTIVRVFLELIKEEDFLIVAGKGLCSLVKKHNRAGTLYMPNHEDVVALALGISLGTKKRIFVLCEDAYAMKHLSSLANAGISEKKNLYVVLIGSGIYQDDGGTFTTFDSLKSEYHLFYSMGFTVHDYKKFFKDRKISARENNKAILNFSKGPLLILLEAEKDLLKEDFKIDLNENFNECMAFIRQPEV